MTPVGCNQLVTVLRGESQLRHHFVNVTIQQGHVQVCGVAVQLLHFVQQLCHLVHVLPTLLQFRLQLILPPLQLHLQMMAESINIHAH